MMNKDLMSRIVASVRDRYGRLDAPDFGFLLNALANTPMRDDFIRTFDRHAAIEEDTDPNDDVAIGFRLRRDGEHLFVQMSVIGPYALLRRIVGERAVLVESPTDAVTSLERRVISFLEDHDVQLLDRKTLAAPLRISLSNTPAEEATVFNALFSDTEPHL